MTNRRTFLALLGVAAATSAAGTNAVSATATSNGESSSEAADTDPDDPATALLEYVVALYGDRLDDDDLEIVRGGIEGSLAAGEAFRDVGLENADAPAFGFDAYRGDES